MNLLFLLLSTVLSVVISHEKCYDKFCYAWDRDYKIFTTAKKCQSPYWDLEIYDDDILQEVKDFVTGARMWTNIVVPLGMTCEGAFCYWKKLNIMAEFNKIHQNIDRVPQGAAVFFVVPDINAWRLLNIDDQRVAIICMRSKDTSNHSTSKQNELPKEPNMLIIGVVLGLASLALVMLLIALLVVVFRRKRNKLKSSTTRSRSFENYRITHPVNSPASLQSSDYADVLPSPETSSTYVNPSKLPNCPTESTNILYADLDWSAEHNSKATEINASQLPNSKNEDTSGFYENHSSFKVIGPMGDEYALVNKK